MRLDFGFVHVVSRRSADVSSYVVDFILPCQADADVWASDEDIEDKVDKACEAKLWHARIAIAPKLRGAYQA